MFLVECPSCGERGYTEACGPGDFDAAVRCTSPAGEPPGSVDGCCSTRGHTHEEHVSHVRVTGDASSRPVVITVLPGGAAMTAGG